MTGYVFGVFVMGLCPNYTFVLIVYTLRCRNKQKGHMLRRKNGKFDHQPTARMVINAYNTCGPNNMCIYLRMWRNSPSKGLGRLNVKVSRSYKIRHTYIRQDSSALAISSSQRQLPTQHTNIRVLGWDSNPQSQQVSSLKPTP